jgi:hypothetical protein
VLIEKKIIIEPGLLSKQLWLCGAALQRYLQLVPVRKTDSERTFYTDNKRERVFVRERAKCIHLTYTFFPERPKRVSGKALRLGDDKFLCDRKAERCL